MWGDLSSFVQLTVLFAPRTTLILSGENPAEDMFDDAPFTIVTFTFLIGPCRLEVVVLLVALVEVRVVLVDATRDFELSRLDSAFVELELRGCPDPSSKYPAARATIRTTATTPAVTKLRLISDPLEGRGFQPPAATTIMVPRIVVG